MHSINASFTNSVTKPVSQNQKQLRIFLFSWEQSESSDICRLYVFICHQDKLKTESGIRLWEQNRKMSALLWTIARAAWWSHFFPCHFHNTNPTENVQRKIKNSFQRMHELTLFSLPSPHSPKVCVRMKVKRKKEMPEGTETFLCVRGHLSWTQKDTERNTQKQIDFCCRH